MAQGERSRRDHLSRVDRMGVGPRIVIQREDDRDMRAIRELTQIPNLGAAPELEKIHAAVWRRYNVRSGGLWLCRFIDGTPQREQTWLPRQRMEGCSRGHLRELRWDDGADQGRPLHRGPDQGRQPEGVRGDRGQRLLVTERRVEGRMGAAALPRPFSVGGGYPCNP